MIRLASAEPAWLELFPANDDTPAAEVQFAPIGIKAVRAARRALAGARGVDEADEEEAGDALSREIIRRGLLDWRGFGDADGNTVAVTPETIEAFVTDPRTFERADRLYVWPWLARHAEGNVSSASPVGTGEAATPEADTASSAATPDAAPAAKPARTRSKSRAPRKARGSGKRSSAAVASSATS